MDSNAINNYNNDIGITRNQNRSMVHGQQSRTLMV